MIMNHRRSAYELTLSQITRDLQSKYGMDRLQALNAISKMFALAFGPNEEAKASFRNESFVPAADTWDKFLTDMIRSDARLRTTLQLRLPTSRRYADPIFPQTLEHVRRVLLRRDALFEGESAHPDLIQAIYRLIDFPRETAGALTPEAEDYATECLRVRKGDKVYCAYAASTGIALLLASSRKLPVTLELEGPQYLAEICAWLTMAGNLNLNIIGGDPLERFASDIFNQKQIDEKSEVAFVCPPSDQRTKDSEVAKYWSNANLPASTQMCGANAILATMRARRSICFTDGNLLFNTHKIDQIFKGTLIRQNKLDTIVGLHATIYKSATSNHGSMLIFGSAQTNLQENIGGEPRVLMVDARLISDLRDDATYGDLDEPVASRVGRIVYNRDETDISYLVSMDEIDEQDFNLVVDRYVYPQLLSSTLQKAPLRRNTLEQVADIHRPQPLPSANSGLAATRNGFQSYEEEQSPYFEVGVLDIEDVGIVRRPIKNIPGSPELLQRLRKSRLEPGDIIMVVKGSVGKVAYIREIPPHEIWLASQSFVIIRLRQYTAISEPLFLFRFLSSKTGQMLIKPLTVGTAVAGLQMADVRRIRLIFPRTGQEEAVASEVKELFAIQDEIETLRRRITIKGQSIWPEQGLFE